MRPHLLYLTCLIVLGASFGASFGVSLLVFPAADGPIAAPDAAPALTAASTPDIAPTTAHPRAAALPATPAPLDLFAPPAATLSQVAPAAGPSHTAVLLVEALPAEPLRPDTIAAPAATSAQQAEPPIVPTGAAIRAKPREPALKKQPVRREPAARRPTPEALRAVRRFGDDLQDIPASSYAADGTRRSIVIRPTSIQDVYYYAVPR